MKAFIGLFGRIVTVTFPGKEPEADLAPTTEGPPGGGWGVGGFGRPG